MLQQTTSKVYLKGLLITEGSNYREGKTRSANPRSWRSFRGRVQIGPNNEVPIECFGMAWDKVTFFEDGGKGRKETSWKNRHKKLEGYYTFPQQYDVAKELSSMENKQPVFITGHIEPNAYVNKNGDNKVLANVVVDRVSLENEIDFKAEDYTPMSAIAGYQVIFDSLVNYNDNNYLEVFLVNRNGESYPIRYRLGNDKVVSIAEKLKSGDLITLTCQMHGFTINNNNLSGGSAQWVETENGLELKMGGGNSGPSGTEVVAISEVGVSEDISEVYENSILKTLEEQPKKESKPAPQAKAKPELVMDDVVEDDFELDDDFFDDIG